MASTHIVTYHDPKTAQNMTIFCEDKYSANIHANRLNAEQKYDVFVSEIVSRKHVIRNQIKG